MGDSMHHASGVGNEVWRAWVEKGLKRNRAAARRNKAVAGVAVVLLIVAYLLDIFLVK
jgi:hypothetical protein